MVNTLRQPDQRTQATALGSNPPATGDYRAWCGGIAALRRD